MLKKTWKKRSGGGDGSSIKFVLLINTVDDDFDDGLEEIHEKNDSCQVCSIEQHS